MSISLALFLKNLKIKSEKAIVFLFEPILLNQQILGNVIYLCEHQFSTWHGLDFIGFKLAFEILDSKQCQFRPSCVIYQQND